MRHEIPTRNWQIQLARAIKNAERGDTIVVDSENKKELAEAAIERLGKEGLTVEVNKNPTDK